MLRPSLDVVFKLLFAAERNRGLLIALLDAVLRPQVPIVGVEVVNPEVEKTTPEERGLVLDLVVEHADGSRTDVEMQAENRGETAERALYHWARLYSDAIVRGEGFSALPACRVVFFLDFPLLGRLHSTFGVREVHHGEALSDRLRIDMIELPRSDEAGPPEDEALRAWASFLGVKSDEELRRVVMAHPEIEEAAAALETLSQDPEAQRIARWRQDELMWRRREQARAVQRGLEEGRERGLEEGRERGLEEGRERGLEEGRERGLEEGRERGLEEGREKGREEGREEGRAAELRAAIASLCEVLDIPFGADRAAQVEAAGSSALEALKAAIVQRRAWPEASPST